METSNGFRGKYSFLSNFYMLDEPLLLDNVKFSNTEAAFQAYKCIKPEDMKQFEMLKPAPAKKLGRKIKMREDWEEIKYKVMYFVVYMKFANNEELKQKLLDTGDMVLVEYNSWNDKCWGVDQKTGIGTNWLGFALMEVREKLGGAKNPGYTPRY